MRATAPQSRHNLIYWRYGVLSGLSAGRHGTFDQNGNRFAIRMLQQTKRWSERGSGHRKTPARLLPEINGSELF